MLIRRVSNKAINQPAKCLLAFHSQNIIWVDRSVSKHLKFELRCADNSKTNYYKYKSNPNVMHRISTIMYWFILQNIASVVHNFAYKLDVNSWNTSASCKSWILRWKCPTELPRRVDNVLDTAVCSWVSEENGSCRLLCICHPQNFV